MVDLLTPLPDPPARLTNDRNELVQKVDQWFMAQKTLVTEYNTSVGQLNDRFTAIEDQAEAATDAADGAASALASMQDLADVFVSIAAGGNIYKTKAALTAALASILEGQFALVLADESQGSDPTIYQKSGGAAVLALNLNQTMGIDDISGLQTALDGKAAAAHSHAIGGVTGLADALADKAPAASPELTGDVFLKGRVRSEGAALGGTAIDLATKNHFTKTVAANTTFTFANKPAGVFGFSIQLDYTSGTIAFPAEVKFADSAVVTWTAGKRYILIFLSYDGGTTIEVSRLGPFTVA